MPLQTDFQGARKLRRSVPHSQVRLFKAILQHSCLQKTYCPNSNLLRYTIAPLLSVIYAVSFEVRRTACRPQIARNIFCIQIVNTDPNIGSLQGYPPSVQNHMEHLMAELFITSGSHVFRHGRAFSYLHVSRAWTLFYVKPSALQAFLSRLKWPT